MVPLLQHSAFSEAGALGPFADAQLAEETPLFAADLAFARQHGGPITRAFVDSLPPTDHGIIDSGLVWLTPGLAHVLELAPQGGRPMAQRAAPRFAHEPFPGVRSGVRGEANRNQEARHRLCVLGVDCAPEAACGEVRFADAAEAEAFWLPEGSLEARDAAVERLLAAGTLQRHTLPINTLIDFGWGALMRTRVSTTMGFQFILRASLHAPRPVVNGRRTLMML